MGIRSDAYFTFDPVTGWSAPKPSDMGRWFNSCHLGIDSQGGVTAVWILGYGGKPVTFLASRFVSGSGWTEPQRLPYSKTVYSVVLNAGVDAQGNAILIWNEEEESEVWSARFDVVTGWSAARCLGEKPSNSSAIAVNSAGDAVAVWIKGGSTKDIMAARYMSDGGWGRPVLVASGSLESPKVSIDRQGNALILWLELRRRALARRLCADGTLEAVEKIADYALPGDYDIVRPYVISDSAGNGMAVFASSDRFGVWTSRYRIDKGWNKPESFAVRKVIDFVEPVIDGDGNVFVIWVDEENDQTLGIWSARYSKE